VAMSELPLTPGGKIDRKALPTPPGTAVRVAHGESAPRDGIELALSRLWAKLLKLPAVGRTDNFFECGGDSLLGAVLVSRIESIFQADVPLADFLAAPTIADTAGLIRGTSLDPAHRRMLCTWQGGSETPFFFVPGAGVLAAQRNAFAGSAPGRRSHYVLQYRGIDGVEEPMRTIPEIARCFLDEVRKIQPTGPYLLGGGSFGALVALDAAHTLSDEGDVVKLLVVEDCLLPGCLTPRAGLPWHARLERALLGLMPVGKRFGFTRGGLRDGLRQWRYRALVPAVRWWSRRHARPMPKVYRFHDLLNHALTAKRRHALRPYPGRVALLRTQFEAAARLFDLEPTLGWGRLCPRLECHHLPGAKGAWDLDAGRQVIFLERLEAILARADGS
jgi:Thioesterase domain/Phosphopantetheine attachment site